MSSPVLRVRPRVWIGFAIWIAYVLVVFGVQVASGIPYDEWGDSGSNLFLGGGLSLIVATILLAITTSVLGWWRPALFEDTRSHHRWPVFVPILLALTAILTLAVTDWASYDGAFFAASLVLLLVGFTEEMTSRGLMIVALRSRLSEVWVWFLSSAAFGLMHFMNFFLGQDLVPTLIQVGSAFAIGTVFYILRRTTGTLIWAMVLHAVWDFSVFAVGHGNPGPLANALGVLQMTIGILAIAVVWFTFRSTRTADADATV
ncbi:CPBP family intramembrane metalloprotease [Microbacterium sp. KSW4-16]|uniref:CPBP family intramembrane metalloprotease n=1 Tax=Microbacterium aurugineum TaxID=2851642 RepID=A0ABY4IVA5_9MICO|nr:CPBP family intramembrane glutamic endopeptidase [Microbacterium aurugineum]MCK8468702.1 CPBP family intramembrane metalloprotease [Microbacterium aurugineum]UPL16711.1 CPBP family intramembrane metalloprotease [Microbacterium aurugineum]